VVIAPPGSGKTALARALAARLGAAHIELNAVLHGPGGQEPTVEQFRSIVLPQLDDETWVVDAWHERILGTLALERADTIVYLDPPLPLVLRRLVTRSLAEILFRRRLWNGNRQTWCGAFGGRNSLVGYAIRRHPDMRRRLPETLQRPELQHVRRVHLTSARRVRHWLQSEGEKMQGRGSERLPDSRRVPGPRAS